MLEQCTSAKERWGGVNVIIDNWLQEREEMLMLYCAITGMDQYTPDTTSVPTKVKAFCQILVDYVSAGHFEVYEQLLQEGQDFNDGGLDIAQTLFPKISGTTQNILDFNDKYDNDDHCEASLKDLSVELSDLGETLARRFEWEDTMIHQLHTTHQGQVA